MTTNEKVSRAIIYNEPFITIKPIAIAPKSPRREGLTFPGFIAWCGANGLAPGNGKVLTAYVRSA